MKKLAKVLVATLFSATLLCTGVFLTSCKEKLPPASVSSSLESMDIEVGQQASFTFNTSNYKNSGEVFISAYDGLTSSSSNSSGENSCEHISWSYSYEGSGVTKVTVEGISGGTSTIVATSSDNGNATKSVVINVTSYSDTLSVKNDKLFVSKSTSLRPKAEDFKFSEGTTNQNLSFYVITNKDALDANYKTGKISRNQTDGDGTVNFSIDTGSEIKARPFDEAVLDSENKNLVFIKPNYDSFTLPVLDTEENYFIAEHFNSTTQQSYYIIASFSTFFGINSSDFVIEDENGEEVTSLNLIAYSQNYFSSRFYVSVPNFSGLGQLKTEFDNQIVAVATTPITSTTTTTTRYQIDVNSTSTKITDTSINFTIAYSGFYGTNDENVSLTKKVAAFIKVKPRGIRVNGEKELSKQVYYNTNIGDYGFTDYLISVTENSSYSGVKIEADDNVQIRQGLSEIKSGFVITDLQTPVRIRGSHLAAENATGTIKFSVISDTILSGESPVEISFDYIIKKGSDKLYFSHDEYNYSTLQPDNGIYVSSKNINQTLDFYSGIYALAEFNNVFVTHEANERDVAEIIVADSGIGSTIADRHYLKLKIRPLKVGIETFNIRLDNGAPISATIRVVDTFENVTVNQVSDAPLDKNVQSVSKKTVGDDDTEMDVILRNSFTGSGYNADAQLTVSFSTNYGKDVITSITDESGSKNNIILSPSDKYNYIFTTAGGGDNVFSFTVFGNIVNDDFLLEQDSKIVSISAVAYNPVQSIEVTEDGGVVPNRLIEIGEETLSLTLIPQVTLDSFNFFKFDNDYQAQGEYRSEGYNQEFVYWTTSADVGFSNVNRPNTEVARMISGNVYDLQDGTSKIGISFDLTSEPKLIINGREWASSDKHNIVLYANIMQYGLSRSFAVNITINKKTEVKTILSNAASQVNFTEQNRTYSFEVRLNPNNATNLGLASNIKGSELENLIEFKQQDIRKGVYFITLTLSLKEINNDNRFIGEKVLIIYPLDWTINDRLDPAKQQNALNIILTYSDGSETNPYYLSTAEDIRQIGNNSNTLGAYYKISSTINVESISSSFPLGEFKGTIIGSNNAKITGIKINRFFEDKNDFLAGLFTKMAGKIENVAFEGSFDDITISANKANISVGLIAGINSGTLKNVYVTINSSDIEFKSSGSGDSTVNSLNIGGIVGENSGTIIKEFKKDADDIYKNQSAAAMVMFAERLNITINCNVSTANIFTGGICGQNSGSILENGEISSYSYSGYMAKNDIYVSGTAKDTDYGLVALGGIAGKSTGNIGRGASELASSCKEEDYMIVGGSLSVSKDLKKAQAAGIAGLVEGVPQIKFVKVRTYLRATKVAAVCIDDTNLALDTGRINNIVIEAVDDGGLKEDASMIVNYYDSTDNEFSTLNITEKQSYIAFSDKGKAIGDGEKNYNISFNTYVSRTIENANIIQDTQDDKYYGDYIIFDESEATYEGIIKGHYEFTKIVVADLNSLELNENANSINLTVKDDETAAQMFTMYYFKAESYTKDDFNQTFTTEGLVNAQNILDRLYNTVKVDDALFMPFKLDSSITISAESGPISIDSSGALHINGTGLAKLRLSSTLDSRKNKEVYIYVINYVNLKSEQSIYLTDSGRLFGQDNNLKLYAHRNEQISIEPNYLFEVKDENDESNVRQIVSENGIISVSGEEGVKDIQLVKSNPFITTITGSEDYNNRVLIDQSVSTITLSRKKVSLEAGSVDTLTLSTSLSVNVGEKVYTSSPNDLLDLSINLNYYTGATSVDNEYSQYSLNTSSSHTDEVTITTDDDSDYLHYEIRADFDTEFSKETGHFGDSNEGKTEDNLFNVVRTNKSGQTYSIEISVNKNSSKYINRFKNNIFGRYIIDYYADTYRELVCEVVLILDDSKIDNIFVENYSNELEAIASKKVVPGQNGLLSFTFSPVDVDFAYFEITNDDQNYEQGAYPASFTFGALSTSGEIKFIPLQVSVTNISGGRGVRISKENLINGVTEALNPKNFDGQFYVRYYIGNQPNVLDGQPIKFNFGIYDEDLNPIYSDSRTYNIFKQFSFDFTIEGRDFAVSSEADVDFYVARGMNYQILIDNTGFDADSITFTSSNSTICQNPIRAEDGHFYLNLEPNELGGSTDRKFTITATATRLNERGQTIETSVTHTFVMMEFVVTYDGSSEIPQDDIVEGVNNGRITVAIGSKNTLKIDMGNRRYIEYNRLFTDVEDKVNKFLSDLTFNGSWNLYTDIGKDVVMPDRIENVDPSIFDKREIKSTSKFDTTYISVDNNFEYYANVKHDPVADKHYIFTYESYIKPNLNGGIYDGNYEIKNEQTDGYTKLYSEFSLSSYVRGAMDSPEPITDYEELKALDEKNDTQLHYILVSDIYIDKDTFTPIRANIGSLDGNGYSIIFKGSSSDTAAIGENVYDVSSLTRVGLFSQVNERTLLKNIKIKIGEKDGDRVVFTTTTANARVGVLAVDNAGNITNARVEGGTVELRFTGRDEPEDGSIIAGLVAENSGNITNSQVLCGLSSKVSVGGIVGNNSGKIASSYYKGGILSNIAGKTTKSYVGGVAVTNLRGGTILTSYSSGTVDSGHIYSYNTNLSRINSDVLAGGFVYANWGEIRDSYANLPIYPNSNCAGFVYLNAGKVVRCFSTSIIIQNNSSGNHTFAAAGQIEDQRGSFESCFGLEDSNAEYLNERGATVKGINQSLTPETIEGVSDIDCEGFKNYSLFNAYNYSTSPNNYNNVWMFIEEGSTVSSPVFQKTELRFNEDGLLSDYQNSYKQSQIFSGGRLELVEANRLSTSHREIDKQRTVTDAYGNTTYAYRDYVNTPGGIWNPYIVYSAQSFEDYLTNFGNSSSAPLDSYIRIVNDLDYTGFGDISTHRVVLKNIIEGNGMQISSISISSSQTLESAGLISEVSGSITNPAGIMNLTILPLSVNFPNAKIVGSLVGRVSYANVSNIKVLSNIDTETEGNTVTVSGRNIVGGVIGLVYQNANVKAIESTVGAKASIVPNFESDQIYRPNGDINQYSYAGGVVGYAYSTGQAITFDGIYSHGLGAYVIGSRAGFVFGGLSKTVNANKINVAMSSSMVVRAYSFGGLVAGESGANMTNVVVEGNSAAERIFSLTTYVPEAIGGVVGYMTDGSLENVYMAQGFNNLTSQDVNKIVEYTGGIVGIIDSGNNQRVQLSKIIVDADLSSRGTLGGVVGISRSPVEMEQVSLNKSKAIGTNRSLTVEGRRMSTTVGGFIGAAQGSVKIENSYSNYDIKVSTYVYNTSIDASVGSIVGAKPDATMTLNNIYTTTIYEVNLEDKNSTDLLQSVGYGESGNITVGDQTKTNVNYHRVLSEDKGENNKYSSTVFHFIPGYAQQPNVVLSNTTLFKVRCGELGVTLNQYEPGVSIVDRFTNDHYEGIDKGVIPSIDMMYKLVEGTTVKTNAEGDIMPEQNKNNTSFYSYYFKFGKENGVKPTEDNGAGPLTGDEVSARDKIWASRKSLDKLEFIGLPYLVIENNLSIIGGILMWK